MSKTSHLIALDWGTSSLRAGLLAADGTVLAELETADGIRSIPDHGFDGVFKRLCDPWLRQHPGSAVLAAGMIGSRQGWCEAPYVRCPAGFDAIANGMTSIRSGGISIGLVPGLVTSHASDANDVMRGEEVQILGALAVLGLDHGIFVLPGTHSKWAIVEENRICQFHTFMTGEVFGLMRRHSILAAMIPPNDSACWKESRDAFHAGCRLSLNGCPLHSLFSVRTQALFDTLAPELRADYLSGLLIGEEIREALELIGPAKPIQVTLLCKPELVERYQTALSSFAIEGIGGPPHASFRGMLAIARACDLVH